MPVRGVKFNKLELGEDSDVDYELQDTNGLLSTHANMVPLISNVPGVRSFYAARFGEQALPLLEPEAPWVRNMDNKSGRSFDFVMGEHMGAKRAKAEGVVEKVTPDEITVRQPDGMLHTTELYNQFPGNRKSVTGDTEVFIRRQGAVLKLRITDYTEVEGDEVSSYDPITKRSSWQRITGFIRHKNDKQLFRVTFASGRSVGVTEDHSLLTLGDNGELVPIYPEQCIAKSTKCPVVFADPGSVDGWTAEQGILDGLFLAEGCYGGKRKPREGAKKRRGAGGPGGLVIAVEPAMRKAYVKALVFRVTGKTAHASRNNVTWCDKQLRARWHSDFGEYAHGKFIACEVFSRGRAYLSGLVAGYFGGDGSVWKDTNGSIQMLAVTVSETLRDDLVAVLNTLGVMCTITGHPRTRLNAAWRDGFGVRPVTSDLFKLNSWFCFEDKEAILRAMMPNVYCSSRFDYLPVTAKMKDLIYETHPRLPTTARRDGFPGGFPKPIYKAVSRGWIDKKLLAPCGGVLEAWANSDIRWDTVKKVEPIPHEEEVYDFSVVSSEAFALASGLLVHNTLSHNTATVQPGQQVKLGDLLAKSNFTDNEGRTALGRNLRIAIVPYKGYSMDDAVVISQSAANKMTSDHAETVEHEADEATTLGRDHFTNLFPKKFTADQTANIDDHGVVKPGTILQPGDPLMLMTRPRSFSSQNQNVGRLSRAQRFVRKEASKVWDGADPAEVLDTVKTRDGGIKVLLRYQSPTRPGDKVVLRNGQKGTVSLVIPDEHMPRTEDGQPLDAMMNQLGLPSRVNAASFYELLLGKIAAKTGKAYTLPAFLPKGETWDTFVENELAKHGINPEERIYDPKDDVFLDNAVTVGNGHMLKLHHLSSGKLSSRGQQGYSLDNQPLKGGGSAGGAQRLSGLEMNVLHSSGARGVQKEAVLLRGERRDDYWRQLRANRTLPKLDKPFVWDKFRALLAGTGVNTKDMGKGVIRLTPMTDKELGLRGSIKIQNDGIVDLADFEPKPGGLFDPFLVREKKWGHIDLPFPVINPSYEETVRTLLGVTKPEYERLMEENEEEPEISKNISNSMLQAPAPSA